MFTRIRVHRDSTEHMDVIKELLSIMQNQGMNEQSQDFLEVLYYIAGMQIQLGAMVEELQGVREQLAQIQGALAAVKASEKELDLGSLELKMKNVQEEDWANNWKKYFKPFPVGEKIMIKPSWEELTEETDKVILKIDPGHIFGTGTHETTQLCMELIEKYVKKDDMVLDIGCGSGILSIASLLLEAKEADAVDIDPNAIAIAYENSDRNDIPREKYHVCAGNILEDAALHENTAAKNMTW